MRFLLRRLLHGALLLVGVSILSFALFDLAPGDALDELKVNPQIPSETIEQIRRQYGLDQPLANRYLRWAASTLRGELGLSLSYGMPVADLIWHRAAATLLLSLTALLLAWSLALPLGVWCASKPTGLSNRMFGAFASILVSLPDLLIGLLCITIALRYGVGPVNGSLGWAAVALAAVSFPAVFRHTRSSVSQTLQTPFVLHLRACGLTERRILFRHVLPASLNPVISLLGLSIASLLSSSLVIEVILGWQGLGPLLLEAILARDVPVVLAAILLSSVLLLAGNLAADLLLYASDPRIRTEEAR